MVNSPFMKFWFDLNQVLNKHGLPDMTYGPARDLFARHYKF